MRKVVIVILLAICSLLYAQSSNPKCLDDLLEIDQYFRHHTNYKYASMIFGAVSVVPFFLPPFLKSDEGFIVKNGMEFNYFLGGSLILTGILCHLESVQYLKMAKKKVELYSQRNSVGLIVKF